MKTIDEIDTELASIKQKIDFHKKAVSELKSSKNELIQQKARIKFGIEIGCVVKHRGQPFKVTLIETVWETEWIKPWLYGSPKNKCGEWSKSVRALYADWELVAPQP
jgi:hypothetical protein